MMMMVSKMKLLRAAVFAGLALAASQSYAACTFGSAGEPSLQNTFDTLLGADTVNVHTACLADGSDSAWATTGQVGSIDIQIELTANAQSNTFGIYDVVTGNRIRVFEGDDGANTLGVIRISQSNGAWSVRVLDTHDSGGEGTNWGSSFALSSSAFGFYLGTTAGGTFYSETARNTDAVDHMYAYGPLGGNFPGEYIMAWEDTLGGGDLDHQDFVATVQDITPVPLPTAVWLLGSGLIGLAGVARRRGTV
jgi:hypothetical protein